MAEVIEIYTGMYKKELLLVYNTIHMYCSVFIFDFGEATVYIPLYYIWIKFKEFGKKSLIKKS